VHKYLKAGCEEHGARLFSLLSCDKTRNNGHKLKYRKFTEFPLKCKKNIFYSMCGQCWNRSSREAEEILGDTQNLTGHSPEYPAVADAALSRRLV